MKKSILLMMAIAIGQFIFAQDCTELFISEYVEGSGNNKAIEIYNPTNEAIDLSIYTIKRYSNGSPSFTDQVELSGSIQPHDVVVVTNGQTDSVWVSSGGYWSLPISEELYEMGDLSCSGNYPTAMYFNGNDAITLEKITGEVVDIFGETGNDPGSNGWNDIPPTYYAGDEFWTSWTKDQTLIRKPTVKQGVTENPDKFMVNVEYDSIPKDTWDSLGFHTCDCYTSGISNQQFGHSIVMYPNPTTNKTVTLSASEKIEFVNLVNQLGQVVYSKEIETGQKSIVVQGDFLTEGNYIITVRFIDGTVYSDKLLVQ